MNVNLEHLEQLASIDSRLSLTPISKPLRRRIINEIFGISLTEQQFNSANGFDTYFCDWYEEQCEIAAGHVSVTTHREILDLIVQLRSTSLTREELLNMLSESSASTDEKLLNASIDLAARLLLLLSVGSVQQSFTPGSTIAWEKNRLHETIHGALRPQVHLKECVKLPRTFTAANLERVAGMKVKWTNNLADHLSLTDDDHKVMLFHQASFLELHRNTKW